MISTLSLGLQIAHILEVYETSEEVLKLPNDEKTKRYLDFIRNEYRGRTAKLVRNGHAYYATFDQKHIRKPIHGDSRSSAAGLKALIRTGGRR